MFSYPSPENPAAIPLFIFPPFNLWIPLKGLIRQNNYYLMNIWLSKFDFRTEITGFMMLSSAGFIILIAYLTVSYQAIRAASADPIKAIKYE